MQKVIKVCKFGNSSVQCFRKGFLFSSWYDTVHQNRHGNPTAWSTENRQTNPNINFLKSAYRMAVTYFSGQIF